VLPESDQPDNESNFLASVRADGFHFLSVVDMIFKFRVALIFF